MFWFSVHLIVYSIVLVVLVVVNSVVAPERPWFLLIVFGWCGLVICHAHRLLGGRSVSSRTRSRNHHVNGHDIYERAHPVT
ncbi:MAG: 2TM domain-containing protein [Rhodospirillales bacterium]